MICVVCGNPTVSPKRTCSSTCLLISRKRAGRRGKLNSYWFAHPYKGH